MNSTVGAARSGKNFIVIDDSLLMRMITLINFLILGLIVWPLSAKTEHRILDLLRRTGASDLLSGGLRLWVVGSTILATALLVRRIVKRFRGVLQPRDTQKDLAVDAVLLGFWWTVLLVMCAYAFMLGMAG
jgi:hypothetical protein